MLSHDVTGEGMQEDRQDGDPDLQACPEIKRTENAIPTVLFTVSLLVSACGYMETCVDTVWLTVVVVEHIVVAVLKDSLATRSIGLAVGAVDEFTTALDEILAALVDKWTAGVLGPPDTNAVSGWLLA